ncbi:alkaline phosphatase family protein [Halanaerobium hydrogeniformans]|uniref:Type I phosphodiesterase/nucleotide pyrophosphatase n=1 Tax=Halanaerobium hydrogeniformans TaxID=656519 RepID=E4RJM8_HALHG|nr:alkaline phosphatase family protein [Halanaerobium hydrogeniformans]ADQ15448.1 hypothetical protein Halsa_2031 [Halanaerobium hydrogeniformans]
MRKKIFSVLFLMSLILTIFSFTTVAAEKYLLIHIDGISSEMFFSELKQNNLPNLAEYFAEENMIKHGLTYFPPSTQVVISRIRESKKISEGELLDWDRYDEETETGKGKISVFNEMRSSVDRRARSNFIYGFPALSNLAPAAMLNLPDLIDKYGLVEFYYFSTDTYGHIWGESSQLNKLYQFDRSFGEVADNFPEDLNIIIYSDHGMVFGEKVSFKDDLLQELDNKIENYSYPNIYLNNNNDQIDKDQLSREIAKNTPLDYVFYQKNENKIIGYHPHSKITFSRKGEKIAYQYEGEDTFNYYNRGYTGEFLNEEEWLELTYDSYFPFAPYNINAIFENEFVGDLVTVLNSPKFMGGGYVRKGSHLGLTADSMTVPVLVRGPELEKFYGRDFIRLDSLFEEIDIKNYESNTPDKDDNHLTLSFNGLSDNDWKINYDLSPKYRLKFSGELNSFNEQSFWSSYDIYSGYLSRLWLGAGLSNIDRDNTDAMAKMRLEIKVNNFLLEYKNFSSQDSKINFVYSISNNLALTANRDLEYFGFRYHF